MNWLLRLFGVTPYPEKQRVIINLKSGTALRGVLYDHAGRYIVVREAELMQSLGKAGGKPVVMDGEALVLLTDVDFIQVLR